MFGMVYKYPSAYTYFNFYLCFLYC